MVIDVGAAWNVVCSPDGRRLATGDLDTARVWDASNGQEFVTVIVGSWVWGVAFSPDGRRLATASEDYCTAQIWVLGDGE